jgi:AcrR family transcriptional regulator
MSRYTGSSADGLPGPAAGAPATRPSRSHRAPSERVRTAVLGAARALIEEDGFFGLTVDALVTRSGISKATIYRWWENRTAIALDVLVLAHGYPDDAYLPSKPDVLALDLVRARLRAEADFLRGPSAPIVAGLIADAQRYPDRARTLEQRYLGPRREKLRALLRSAASEGVLPASTDVDALADALEGCLYSRLLFGHGNLDRTATDQLLDQLLGLRG